jgi:CheY-like chemotaxis protein
MAADGQPQRSLRILLVEDSPEDAELLLNHLSEAGLVVQTRRVDSAETMVEALAEQP